MKKLKYRNIKTSILFIALLLHVMFLNDLSRHFLIGLIMSICVLSAGILLIGFDKKKNNIFLNIAEKYGLQD